MRNPQWQKLATLKLDISKRCRCILSLSMRVHLLGLGESDVVFISRGWEGWTGCRVVMTYCVPFRSSEHCDVVDICKYGACCEYNRAYGKVIFTCQHLPKILQSQISVNCSVQHHGQHSQSHANNNRGVAVTFGFLKDFTWIVSVELYPIVGYYYFSYYFSLFFILCNVQSNVRIHIYIYIMVQI